MLPLWVWGSSACGERLGMCLCSGSSELTPCLEARVACEGREDLVSAPSYEVLAEINRK